MRYQTALRPDWTADSNMSPRPGMDGFWVSNNSTVVTFWAMRMNQKWVGAAVTPEQLLKVERGLLAGTLSDDAWNAALVQCAELVGASYLAVMTRDQRTGQFRILEPVDAPPRLLEDFENEFRDINPWNIVDVLSRDGETRLDWEVLGHDVIRKDPFYQDFMRPHGLSHTMGHRVDAFEGVSSYLSIHKRLGDAPFDADAVAVLAALHGSLRQALAVRQKLRGLAQAQVWQRVALDALDFPIMLLDASGGVRQTNRAADAWLSGPGGGLLSARKTGRDQQALFGIVRQALGKPGEPPRAAALRLSFDTPYAGTVCVAIPVDESGGFHAACVGAALLMIWPARPREPAQVLLRQVFGLSETEARVAALLAQGRTPREIAGLRSVTEATVRSHIKSLFSKMHVRRQHDLARLLTELALVDTPSD